MPHIESTIMSRNRPHPSFLMVAALLFFCGCESPVTDLPDVRVVTAQDLAGNYTGILEGVTVPSEEALADRTQHVIIDLDLLHEVRVEDHGALVLLIESAIIPSTRAIIAGLGSVAVNLEFVEFEGLDLFGPDHEIRSLKVKQIVFVEYEGEWIFVLQIARVGFAGDEDLDGIYVYQYVSYPEAVAQQMSENEAIVYVNTILRLVSAAQRH